MKVVLSNAALPQNGVATIPLPIPKEDYDNCIFILKALEIGSQFHADCKVEEISVLSTLCWFFLNYPFWDRILVYVMI